METTLTSVAAELLKNPAVKGVLCANEDGSSLFNQGSMTESSAAVAAQLAALSGSVEPNSQPIVTLNTGTSKVILTKNGTITTAIHKQL